MANKTDFFTTFCDGIVNYPWDIYLLPLSSFTRHCIMCYKKGKNIKRCLHGNHYVKLRGQWELLTRYANIKKACLYKSWIAGLCRCFKLFPAQFMRRSL